jgi:hypothetical protein
VLGRVAENGLGAKTARRVAETEARAEACLSSLWMVTMLSRRRIYDDLHATVSIEDNN